MARRSDTPLAILVVGIFTVCLFGGGTVYITGKTPILQLRLELEKRYQGQRFVTRFAPGNPPHIEVDVPAALGPDERSLADLGLVALERYRELATNTRVEECFVRAAGTEPPRTASVTLDLLWRLNEARGSLAAIQASAEQAGVPGATARVLGPARSGAWVEVAGRTTRGEATRLADRTVAYVASLGYVGRVEVALEGPAGVVRRAGGRYGP